MKRILISLFLLGMPFGVFAFAVPSSGYVVDQAGVIQNVDALWSSLATYDQQTGHQIAVFTIPTLETESLEDVANQVFREWEIGDSKRNDGVLILVVPGDRKARIEVGYGLEGALPDILANRILDDVMIPEFREGRYEAGIISGIEAIKQSIAGEPVFPASQNGIEKNGINIFFVIFWAWIIGGLFWGGLFWTLLGRSKSWWAGGVIGGIAGAIGALIIGVLLWGILVFVGGVIAGLLFDFLASKYYKPGGKGPRGPWFFGGFGGGSSGSSFGGGGGFGGFGGGSSGGGGASGGW